MVKRIPSHLFDFKITPDFTKLYRCQQKTAQLLIVLLATLLTLSGNPLVLQAATATNFATCSHLQKI